MKNIIICGTVGTGKATISKKLSKELKLTYLNDWQLFHEMGMSKVPNSKIFSKIMVEFLRDKQKVVLDSDMSIMPKDYIKCGFDSKVYYLGFVSVDKHILAQKLFAGDTPNMSLAKRKAKYLLKCGKKLFKQCKKYNLPFFEIKEDKDKSIKEIIDIIKHDLEGE